MQADEMIHAFATAGNDLPREAMRSALDQWEDVAPTLLGVLEAYADGADRSDDAASAVFFIAHLAGEARDVRAFGPLCRLARDDEALDLALGDAITESVKRILISTYNGDVAALKAVIEDEDANEFVRAGAVEVMAYLTAAGRVAREDMEAYLWQLRRDMRPRGENFAWVGWLTAAALLGFAGFAEDVREAIKRRWVPYRTLDYSDFEDMLQRALADQDALGRFEDEGIKPFSDAIGELSRWYGFSEQYKADRLRLASQKKEAVPDLLAPAEPYINPMRSVGRNDPCPCGSGKKFKRCCLK